MVVGHQDRESQLVSGIGAKRVPVDDGWRCQLPGIVIRHSHQPERGAAGPWHLPQPNPNRFGALPVSFTVAACKQELVVSEFFRRATCQRCLIGLWRTPPSAPWSCVRLLGQEDRGKGRMIE